MGRSSSGRSYAVRESAGRSRRPLLLPAAALVVPVVGIAVIALSWGGLTDTPRGRGVALGLLTSLSILLVILVGVLVQAAGRAAVAPLVAEVDPDGITLGAGGDRDDDVFLAWAAVARVRVWTPGRRNRRDGEPREYLQVEAVDGLSERRAAPDAAGWEELLAQVRAHAPTVPIVHDGVLPEGQDEPGPSRG